MPITAGFNTETVLTHEADRVIEVDLTPDEVAKGKPSASTVGAAVAALHRDGIVVLNNAVPVAEIEVLNENLVARIPTLLADPTLHFNGGQRTGNIAQSPPLEPELMFPSIWANPHTLDIISSVLGPQPHCNYVLGNTAIGGARERQDVHADLNFNYPSMPFALVANYYLCDTNEQNGATEVWPRSHIWSHFDLHRYGESKIKQGLLDEALHAGFGPLRPSIRKGSVVIRDLRLWHAGIPNPSKDPRIMLAFVHFPWWYQNFKRVVLPEAARPFIESVKDRVVYDAEYIDGEVDSTKIAFQAYFGSENAGYNALTFPRQNKGTNPYINGSGEIQAGTKTVQFTVNGSGSGANETVLAPGRAGRAI